MQFTDLRVDLPALSAGGPHELTIVAERTVTLKDVLVGDVWLTAGQSNMRWYLKQCASAKTEIPKANHPSATSAVMMTVFFAPVPCQILGCVS